MTIKKFAITTLASAALVTMAAAPALACEKKPEVKKISDHKVGICHATGSTTNPYVFIVVDKHAAEAHKNHQDGHDVIGVKSADKCPKPTVAVTPTTPETPKSDDLPTGQGQTLGTSTEALPAELPHTGASAGLSALLGLPTLFLAGRAYLRSRHA